jgi:hypothetical protein
MSAPTAAMLAGPSLGACSRMRPGCGELGPWWPFYQAYVCVECLAADRADVLVGRNPVGPLGPLFKVAPHACRPLTAARKGRCGPA